MKILHTADWHLGKKLDNFSRLEEQIALMKEICEIAEEEKVDAVFVVGDLYDNFNPPTEAVQLLYKTLKNLTRNLTCPVIAIAGNHDSPDRIDAPEPLALECGIFMFGYPKSKALELDWGTSELKVLKNEEGFLELKLPNSAYPLRIIHTPYANELRLRKYLGVENKEEELRNILSKHWQELAEKYCDKNGINVLLTHLFVVKRGDSEKDESTKEEKGILHVGGVQAIYTDQIPPQIDYVGLGHLHRCHTVSNTPCPIVYSGSPLMYSFGDTAQDKYVVIIEGEPNQPLKYSKRLLKNGKKLIKKRIEGVENAIQWLKNNQNDIIELTLVTDDFISSSQKNDIISSHPNIHTLIPDVQNKTTQIKKQYQRANLNQSIEELFADFYKKEKKGIEPSESIKAIFKEIISQ